MQLHDVIETLIQRSTVDEATRHDMHAAVADYFENDINNLSDEEKAQRIAKVDRLAGTAPALFVGGLSQDQFDSLVEQAANRLIAKGYKGKDAQIDASKADTAQIAAGQPSTATANPVPQAGNVPDVQQSTANAAPDVQQGAGSDVPAGLNADEVASFRAWQQANQAKQSAATP